MCQNLDVYSFKKNLLHLSFTFLSTVTPILINLAKYLYIILQHKLKMTESLAKYFFIHNLAYSETGKVLTGFD